MSLIDFAKKEFRACGWTDDSGKFHDEMQEAICNHILNLLQVFSDEGHSGTSAPYTIKLFTRLANFHPIAPLTGEDWEWNEIREGLFQNNRCSSVFKENDEAYDSNGIVFWEWFQTEGEEPFKSYFTSSGSRVKIDFPYVKPESPQYVFRPSEDFPNEIL